MAEKKMENVPENSHYLTVKLDSQEEKEGEQLIISFGEIVRQIKRFFLAWFLVAVIVAGLIAGFYVLMDASPASPVTALVSFSYSGIEEGKNPDGTEFQADKLKAPEVIKAALKECDLDEAILESVRHGVVINPIVPSDAMNRITTYSYLYEKAGAGALNAAEKLLDVSWFSTQYQLKFNYGETGLSRDKAAQLLNAMTTCYRDYFIRSFGCNDALGNALNSMQYTDYDYAEAVDLLDDSLTKLRAYVDELASNDTARFRSNVTGFTFSDLRESVDAVRNIDLDQVSSYVTQNNVTKDKERLEAYYEYKIDELSRQQIVYEETLASLVESIEKYQKDNIYVFAEDVNTQSTTASEQYDKMISDKINTQTLLSQTIQRIEYYNQRLTFLRTQNVGNSAKAKKVETELETVNTKVKKLINLVEETADDYYRNYSLTDAYSVLVPASYSAKEVMVNGIKDAFKLVFAVELVLFALYLFAALIFALVISNRKKKQLAAAEAAAADADDDADDADAEAEKNAKRDGKKK